MDLKQIEKGQKIILKKKAGLKLKKAPLPSESSRISTDALITPSTNARESRQNNILNILTSPTEDDRNHRFNFHLFNSQKQFVTELKKPDPIEQIKQIITENEILRLTINQKQKIIENLSRMKQRKDGIETQRNSRSLLQPHEKQNTLEEYGYYQDTKPSLSQNFKRSIICQKLPQIESKQNSPNTRDEHTFTFANNFFTNNQGSPKKINMLQAFPQLHLQKKFFT